MQKRILTIEASKSLQKKNKKYGKKAKNFITCMLGMYDLDSLMKLEWSRYIDFVADLFELKIEKTKLGGIEFNAQKDQEPVLIWDYNKYKEVIIDENFIENIHQNISEKYDGRIFIVAPANSFDFIEDYVEIDNIRYYFLKIPYQVIRELHKTPFRKILQPKNKNDINNIETAVGFHFMRPPTVKNKKIKENGKTKIILEEFKSYYYKDENGKILENFETLSTIFIDENYDGETFKLDKTIFADELEIKDNKITIELEVKNTKVMLIYVDIYGNEFKEIFEV